MFVLCFSYFKAAFGLVQASRDNNKVHNSGNNTFSPSINELEDSVKLRREKEFHAVKFHSLESFGESFLQITIQVYFMFLLVILGTGTVIAGVNAEDFFYDICKFHAFLYL
jgi:hypothetical protein